VCACVRVCVCGEMRKLGVSRARRPRNVSMNVMYVCILDPRNMTECEEQQCTDFDVHTYTLYIYILGKFHEVQFFFFFLVIKWEHLKCAYTHKILLCKHFNTWESVGPSTLPEGGYSATPQGRKLIYWCLPHKASTLLHGQEDKASSEQ